MFHITSLVQKAQSFIESNTSPLSRGTGNPSKASLFRHQFRLPDSQSPLYEITAELTITGKSLSHDQTENDAARVPGSIFVGKAHLSEDYLCFSTQAASFQPGATTLASSTFAGSTQGTGPVGNGFTFPLCAIRRVERLPSSTQVFSLAITTWNGSKAQSDKQPRRASESQRYIFQLAGSRQACERFCDGLKKGLRDGIKHVDNLKAVVSECYSEYLLSGKTKAEREQCLLDQGIREPPDTGLGSFFRYPGDARKLREQSKMRLWREYLKENGRNVTLVRQPTFHKLIRVGLPNRLRGEIWELTSGSLYLRLQKPKQYSDTVAKFAGKASLAVDEIEKDLNRSLPEYPGFQSDEGIDRLRRVLTAYSWTNQAVGYCQAMNIVVAALLIYMSETQAFFLLSILCDRLLPGYYSQTMYGTLLDQRVFESLVEKTMPILWDHLSKADVQLSVVSLPWFLSLYINSMPLVFAFRVLDVFFLEGPKVLFQIGLAILRINGEDLLDVTDDGSFIQILKNYFSRLDESAHPTSENEKTRAITKFQELMVVAFKEFAGITQSSISEYRARHKDTVLGSIESFAKRASIRNLGPDSRYLETEELGFLYDRFYSILYDRQQQIQVQREANSRQVRLGSTYRSNGADVGITRNDEIEAGRVGLGPSTTQMDYDGFREFLAGIARWAITDAPMTQSSEREGSIYSNHSGRSRNASTFSLDQKKHQPADHDFMQRLFGKWNSKDNDGLCLQDVVSGLATIKGKKDIMTSISYFFDLYDDDNDGKVDREGILRMSEALLFLTRRGLGASPTPQGLGVGDSIELDKKISSPEEQFLGSVSDFIRRCFEYADPDSMKANESAVSSAEQDLNHFRIGESDEEDDLLEFDSNDHVKKSSSANALKSAEHDLLGDYSSGEPGDGISATHKAPCLRRTQTANVALDPLRPLHITLPTFRMVILADELLQQFFESAFPTSFHLSTVPFNPSRSQTLTTLTSAPPSPASNTGHFRPQDMTPPARGLRGVLDNIVQDGMRVATEVRKRVDDVGREMERNAALSQRDGDLEDEDQQIYGVEADRRSVRERDQDLLEGAEAEAGVGAATASEAVSVAKQQQEDLLGDILEKP